MRLEKRGIVAKISDNNCIVLTPQGTYARIRRPSVETRVGEEVIYRSDAFSAAIKPMLMAVSLLAAFLIYPVLQQMMMPQAVAYVSLDIYYGVELAVDERNTVIEVKSFGGNSSDLVSQLDLEGRDLYDAAAVMVGQALDLNHIGNGHNNLVVSTIVAADSAGNHMAIDEDELLQAIEGTISGRGHVGQVKIFTAGPELRLAAEKQMLTTGQYLVFEQLAAAGYNPAVEDLNGQSLSQLIAACQKAGLDPLDTDNNGATGEFSIARDGRHQPSVSRGYAGPGARSIHAPGQDGIAATQTALAGFKGRG